MKLLMVGGPKDGTFIEVESIGKAETRLGIPVPDYDAVCHSITDNPVPLFRTRYYLLCPLRALDEVVFVYIYDAISVKELFKIFIDRYPKPLQEWQK